MIDYYGKVGCCLTCEEAEEGCLCYECKCRKCCHYEPTGVFEGFCTLAVPPEGYVKINVHNDIVNVKIEPHLESDVFKDIVYTLKSFRFQYNQANKTWTRDIYVPSSIDEMIKEIKGYDVEVAVKGWAEKILEVE